MSAAILSPIINTYPSCISPVCAHSNDYATECQCEGLMSWVTESPWPTRLVNFYAISSGLRGTCVGFLGRQVGRPNAFADAHEGMQTHDGIIDSVPVPGVTAIGHLRDSRNPRQSRSRLLMKFFLD